MKVICCRLTPKTSIHSHVIDVYIACVWFVSCLVVSLYHFYWLKTNCLFRNAILSSVSLNENDLLCFCCILVEHGGRFIGIPPIADTPNGSCVVGKRSG